MASAKDGLNLGSFIDTGNTAKDAQALANTAIQRTSQDAEAAGINPTWYLTQGGSTSGATAAGAVTSTLDKQQLKINQQNADAASLEAQASMRNANANVAKAVSSFLPKRNINLGIGISPKIG